LAIHPTAIVSPEAELGAGVEIGPYVIVEAGARIGARTQIHARAQVCGSTEMGEENVVHPGVILGHVPQDTKFTGKPSYLRIGHRNVFRENSWLHRGSAERSSTVLGDENYLMGGAHVGHNCAVGNGVILGPNTLLAGHVEVQDHAMVAGNVVIHQFCRIGYMCAISGLSGVGQDVPPYMTVAGRPAAVLGLNVAGIDRAGLNGETRRVLEQVFNLLFRSDCDIATALAQIDAGATTDAERRVVEFVRIARDEQHRGICRNPRKHIQPGLEPEIDDRLANEEAVTLLALTDSQRNAG
jgi:UDP-N-acetylglucosamine acyltransferase